MDQNFTKKTLKNGMTLLHEDRELPVTSISISNRFGAANETSEIKGVAHFIEHLLFTGTEKRTHEDISKEIEEKGGIINAFTHHEITSYWMKMPSEHLFLALEILADMLNNTTFNEEKFEKEKKVILEEIKMYHDMPMYHVHNQIEANLYGKPFGESIIGTKETISALTRDQVSEIFEKNYNPKNYIVTIVGPADIEKVTNFLEENFKPSDSQPKEIEISRISKETTEERENIDQAHFLIGFPAPLRSTKEHTILKVLDSYLANGMSSKLFLEIREKRGLAYAVKSSIDSEKSYSHYSIYVGTTKEAIPEVKKAIIEEIESIPEKFNEEHLKKAKEKLIGLRKISQEESSSVMNALLYYENCTSAEDYYKHEEKINSVTIEEVKEISKELLKGHSIAIIAPKS